MNRILSCLFAAVLSVIVTAGIHSGVASAAEAEAAELDDSLLHWLIRSRWWRLTPEQPGIPTLSDISYDRLTVSWTEPDSAVFDIIDYDVQYRPASTGGFVTWAHDGGATEATITGLAELTEYEVRVRAENEAGEGDWSEAASGTTLLAPPRFVEGESADREVEENTAPGVAIGEPVRATVHEGPLRYSLEGEDADAFAIDVSSGQLRTRQGVDYDHETRSSYAVEVEASHARAGTGRIAVQIMVLDVDEPPDQPFAPALSASGSTGLRVDWDAPVNTGPPISDYDLEYRSLGTEEYLDAGYEGTEPEATITDLARQTLYEVRVRAENDEGVGAWSDPAQGRTTSGGGGGGGQPRPPSGYPDLVVQSASIDDPRLDGGEPFTLSATVRNRGNVAAAATTLRYYRSSNTVISPTDTHIGSDSVEALSAGAVSRESIELTAPASAGTYYFGACADSVAEESNSRNNCSAAEELTVFPVAPAGQGAFDALFIPNFLSTPNYFIQFLSGGRFSESNRHRGSYTYESTGPNSGTVTQTFDDANQYGGSCTIELTFVSANKGTLSYTCAGGQANTEAWVLDVHESGSFNIEVVWASDRRAAVDNAIQAGVARWESVISRDIGAVYISSSTLFGVIDDVRVYARIEDIDGPGGTVGTGGVRWIRRSSSLPAVSAITLDADDVGRLSSAGLQNVVTHEIAHALGFGTLWSSHGLLNDPAAGADTDSPLPDTHFSGANAIAAFDAAGGRSYSGAKVPVENDDDFGGVDGHWRIAVFGYGELMVGSFRVPGPQLPMSAITVQSMADMGYSVNAGAADAYGLPISRSPRVRSLARVDTTKERIPLNCVVIPPAPTVGVTLFELKPD